VTAVFSDRTVTKLQDARILELKDEYWAIIAHLKPALETLKCATTIMSSEKTVSISHINPITFSIINKHMAIITDDRPRVAEFKAVVRKSLSERMEVGYNFGFRGNIFFYIIHSSYTTHSQAIGLLGHIIIGYNSKYPVL
jgi:hypothetical protein